MHNAGSNRDSLTIGGLLGDFRLLLILFISFRVMLLIVYQPLLVDGVERGLGAQGDRLYHYALAELTAQDQWPFRDWWSEFPPVWYWLTTAVYQFQGANANYGSWSMLLGLIVLVFDVGNLILIRKIGEHLHGPNTGMTLAWVYAMTFAPMVFIWWNFETLVAFFLLLGMWWLLKGKENRSAVAIALGALTKFTPALILGAVWRFRDVRAALKYTLVTLVVFALAYLPLFAQNAEMTLPSLTAQFSKPSYQTVWALLDGNYTTGNFGSIESHFDPAQAAASTGNPAVVPSWLRLGLAAAVGLLVYARTRRFDDRGLVAFVGITLLIFFLQAQGWSPQWLVQIIPLVLLTFPTKNGVLIVVILSLVTFVEYPLLFIRTGDSGGVIEGALVLPFTALVLTRTSILIGLCVAFYQRLRQEPVFRQ
ncbi:MAG: DUF2029 domain-containing protein [Anaerolineae bacterium]|nr:DUF2029 domain-containing protein [Anaerolineae bacterium]